MARGRRRSATASLCAVAAALSLPSSAAASAAPLEGSCPAGSLAGPDGCTQLQQDNVLLQLESAKLTAAARGGLTRVDDARADGGSGGTCCFYPRGPDACPKCDSPALTGTWCAASQSACEGCRGIWCPGPAGPSTPATDFQTAPAAPAVARPPAAPAPPPPPPASSSGLLWGDEFEGGELDRSKWALDVGGGGFGNQERQYYTSSHRNARVEAGVLKITAKCDHLEGHSYTSAKLKSTQAWGPGVRVEVRARLPTARGTWPAIWMLPVHNHYGPWPKSGEIDIMEAVGCDPTKVHGTVHTGRYNHVLGTQKTNSMGVDVKGWRTYAVEWEERQIRWYVDGKQYYTFSPSAYDSERWPFDHRFYLILNLAVGGTWGGYCTPEGPSCSDRSQFGTDQVMEVDYARVSALR